MGWADWKVYSKFITWPDEPGWDCWWVSEDYSIGPRTGSSDRVVIPVTYKRIGRFCADAQYEAGRKSDTINYELVRDQGKWKVDGPTPDYPYVGLRAVRKYLSTTISDERESSQLRAQARRVLALIEKLPN